MINEEEMGQAKPLHSDQESNGQTTEAEQKFPMRWVIQTDLSVAETALYLVTREDIQRESLPADDEHVKHGKGSDYGEY
jgi:hypothetical protein